MAGHGVLGTARHGLARQGEARGRGGFGYPSHFLLRGKMSQTPSQKINYRGLNIPFAQLGTNVTTDNLFDPNEQVIFDFYEHNQARYRRVLDIGANVGVHSIIMARLGWQVRAYEPDPVHFDLLLKNVAAHGVAVEASRTAVSDRADAARFVRVLGNTTSNHLEGAKESYGPQEYFYVRMTRCQPLFGWADFAKIDCEGHEAALMLVTDAKTWACMDAMMEVGSEDNACAIYHHLRDLVPMYAQKVGWRRVRGLDDVPKHHNEGSLFVGIKPPFWTPTEGKP